MLIGGGALLLVDLMFLAANLTKLVHGAWLPLLIGLAAFTVMTTWQRGREIVTREREKEEGPLREFIDGPARPAAAGYCGCPGTAVFLNRGKDTTPLAMRANVEHNHVLHEHVIILSIETVPVPRVADAERIDRRRLGYADDGIVHVTAHFGYMETPDVPARAAAARPGQTEGPIAVDEASYFLSKLELVVGDGADDGAVAQTAVHRHVPYHRRRRRAFRPAAGSHGDHGLANRGVARLLESAQIPCRGLLPEGQSQNRTSPWEIQRSAR